MKMPKAVVTQSTEASYGYVLDNKRADMYCHASSLCTDRKMSHHDIADDEDMELCMRRPSIDFSAPHSYMCRMPRSSCQAVRHAVSELNRLDDFNCERIGSGFFSEVFKVTHKTTGQVMVLKMNTSLSNRPNMLREVQLMNRLSHPNILKFMGACVHEGQLHALTEYINGGSLEQLLSNKSKPLSWETRIGLAMDAALGLCYFHSRGVFHRDLTSKNVLIKILEDGRMMAIIADFGLAEKIPDAKKDSIKLPTVGSPYWMAPECLKGKWYNEKADVFSFGIILCEIIARIEADPDILPRTGNFGLDYIAFGEMCPDCPLEFLKLAFSCCMIVPQSRPAFTNIVQQLENMSMTIQLSFQTTVSRDNCMDCISDVCDGRERSKTIVSKMLSLATSCKSDSGFLRRSKSEERLPIQMSPSDKARCHKFTAHGKLRHVVVPMTTKYIGEVMSLGDPHYCPGVNNPFTDLTQYHNGKKIICSSRELFSSCFELPSPSSTCSPPPSPLPTNTNESLVSSNKARPVFSSSESSKQTLVRVRSNASDEHIEKAAMNELGQSENGFTRSISDGSALLTSSCEKDRTSTDSKLLVFPMPKNTACASNDLCSSCESGFFSVNGDSAHVPIADDTPCISCSLDVKSQRNNKPNLQIRCYGIGRCNRGSHSKNKRPSSCYSDDSDISSSSPTLQYNQEIILNSLNMCLPDDPVKGNYVWKELESDIDDESDIVPTSKTSHVSSQTIRQASNVGHF